MYSFLILLLFFVFLTEGKISLNDENDHQYHRIEMNPKKGRYKSHKNHQIHHHNHHSDVKSQRRLNLSNISRDFSSSRLPSSSPLPYCMVGGFYDVKWSTLELERSDTYYNSLPIGNGRLAASVYFVGSTGTIGFLISRPDSWNEAGQMIKTGRLEYTLTPNPFGKGREIGDNYHTYDSGGEGAIPRGNKRQKQRKRSSNFKSNERLNTKKDTTHVYGDYGAEGDATFNITLQVRSASVRLVSSNGWDITTYIAAEVDIGVFNVTSAPANGNVSKEIYPIRTSNHSSDSFQACTNYVIPPDSLSYYDDDNKSVRILKHGGGKVKGKLFGIVHRNYDAGYVRDAISQLNMDPAISVVKDPFTNLTSASAFNPVDPPSVQGAYLFTSLARITGYEEEIATDMLNLMSKAKLSFETHCNTWDALWGRGYICFPKHSNQYIIGQQYTLQRLIQLMTAGTTNPVKFNGLLYTAIRAPNSDYRQWGSHNWWQNLRFPYYNMLGSGDFDYIKKSLFGYFDKSSPFAKMCAKHWFNFTNDALVWQEYTDVIGAMLIRLYGCNRGGKPFVGNMPYWYNSDPWNHYNWQGVLDLSMIIMDATDYTMDTTILEQYGYIINGITEFYMQMFPNGTIYPSQGLETWQCPGYPPNENNCAKNDASTLAGLHSVIPRAMHFGSLIYPANRVNVIKAWYNTLRPVPTDNNGTRIIPCEKCPPHTSNVENVELYPVHPYRVAMIGTPLHGAAVNARKTMPFPSDYGWNQNALDAALLGLVKESSEYVYKRATAGKAPEYRFQAFMPHYQDFPPSGDHLSVMNSALQYMIASPFPFNPAKAKGSVNSSTTTPTPSISGTYLLPAWDCTWDVLFRVHAIGGIMIDGAVSKGKLMYNASLSKTGAKPTIIQLNCK